SALAYPSEHILAAGAEDGRVFVLDPNGRNVRQYDGHTSTVSNLRVSQDEKQLMSSSADGTVLLHRLTGFHPLARLLGTHRGSVTSLAFSPDGKLIASGGWDGSIKVWNPTAPNINPAKLREVRDGLRSRVECVCFTPDRTPIASISRHSEAG